VRRLRKALDLTQLKFAELVGVHEITVRKWEGGTLGMRPSTERLIRLLGERSRPRRRTR
jgi:DNA-binding transcriptional regulator YiaG